MSSSKPTLQDLLDAMNLFASNVDQRFASIDQRFASIDQQFSGIDQRFASIDQQLSHIRLEMITKQDLAREFTKFETRMVSKDYLDAKLTDQYTDLVRLFRKELAQKVS